MSRLAFEPGADYRGDDIDDRDDDGIVHHLPTISMPLWLLEVLIEESKGEAAE